MSATLLRLTGPCVETVHAIAATCPSVARRLVSWTPSYAHALAIYLQAAGLAEPALAKQAFGENGALREADTATLLKLAGFGRLDWVMPLLNRLGGRLRSLDEYRTLEGFEADRRVTTFIRSSRGHLSPSRIKALSTLHPLLRSPEIMGKVKTTDAVAGLNLLVDVASRLCPDVPAEDIRRSLGRSRNLSNEWLEQWIRRARLPEPPYPGSPLLVPLRAGSEFERAALQFRNCLRGRIRDALKGNFAVYLWKGGEQALVGLVRHLGDVWLVEDIKGVGNDGPSAATKRRIREELAAWGCHGDHARQALEAMCIWTE